VLGEAGTRLTVGVSPLGYVAVWQTGDQATRFIPWQTWPHVRPAQEDNEIQVDVVGEAVTVRVNHERLWQGTVAPPGRRLGLYAESFGGAATVDFRTVSRYQDGNH
jgi:hypothetical protein